MSKEVPPLVILAVDSSAQRQSALQDALGADGMTVVGAASAPEALAQLERHSVALALVDAQLAPAGTPPLDAYTLAEQIRRQPGTAHVPVIFIDEGGADEAKRRTRGYEAGAADFLHQPLDTRVLRSKVKAFADLHRQRAQLATRVGEHERLQRLTASMLSALSHDIRTPLQVLALNAELLIRRDGDEVGRRVKAATTMLSRQLDHLVNLAQLPDDDVRADFALGRIDELVQQRLRAPVNQVLVPFELSVRGDGQAQFDGVLLADAVDHLLLQAATHAGDGVVRVSVDGEARRSVALRIAFDAQIDEHASLYLFGGGMPLEGLAMPRVGPGLMIAERAARAHGGSLIGRSKEREGTLFEMMMPRGPLG